MKGAVRTTIKVQNAHSNHCPPTDRIRESTIPSLLPSPPYGTGQPQKCIFKTTMKWGFRIARASRFSVPAGDMRQRAAYSAITICQLLAFSMESGNQRYTHTPNPAGEGTGQDRVHSNPRMWKVDGEESYLQAKAWGFGGSLAVFAKTMSGWFVCFFLSLLSLQQIPD